MIHQSWADKVENDDGKLPPLPLSWNMQSKPLLTRDTNSNPLQSRNSNIINYTTRKRKLSSYNMTIHNIIHSLPPIDDQQSIALYLSNALGLPRRDIIKAIFAVRAPVLNFNNNDIAKVLHQLLYVQNNSQENRN